MKTLPIVTIALALSASFAFAASNSETVNLKDAVNIGSAHLAAGSCKVSWTGDGADVQVTFTEKNAAPVTVPATLKQEKNYPTSVSTASRANGKALISVGLKNVTLVIKDQTVATK